jgi:hypothetical protein
MQTYDIDEIITRMPTPGEVARHPVAEHIRTGYTANDQPVPGHGLHYPGGHPDLALHDPDVSATKPEEQSSCR